jgi:hypothetical protein
MLILQSYLFATVHSRFLFMPPAAAARALPQVIQDLDPALQSLKPLKTKSGSRYLYDNPWAPGATTKPAADIFKLVRTMKVVDPPAAAVAADLPFADLDLAGIHSYKQGDAMRATWIGHATGACLQPRVIPLHAICPLDTPLKNLGRSDRMLL